MTVQTHLLFGAHSRLAGMAIGAASLCMALTARADPTSTTALKQLSLEELMSVEVTSVSRTGEELFGAAAAIAVVSSDDIRRTGATTIPQSLRGVPGLHVAQRNANYWAVSSRGFSGANSEKLLVLSDTRSLYTPLVSGVFWDVQDYLLADVERVEVIRGPGAALWGSNAVNGVINITTKHARDTVGTYLEAGLGTEEEVLVGARYGAQINDDLQLRVFAKHGERDSTYQANTTQSDDWRNTLVGFRSDWQMSAADSLTVQGSGYRGEVGQLAPSINVIGRTGPSGRLRSELEGGNVLARWRRSLAEDSELQVRFYYDHTHRDDPSFVDDLDAYDFDVQHRLQLGSFAGISNHELMWGANYRYTDHENRPGTIFRLEPAASADSVVSAFVQDQMFIGERVRVTVGSKFEDNDFSGFEVQPSVRATWELDPSLMLWGAVSRAVRVPTRFERDIAVDVSNPAGNPVFRLLGNEDFDSEEVIAYELGVRARPTPALFIDVAAFHNRYDGLVSLELGAPFIDSTNGRTVIPVIDRNLNEGESTGVEALVTFVATSSWRLTAHYGYVRLQIDAPGLDLNRGEWLEDATPRHQFGVRSSHDFGPLQLDVQLRSASAIERNPEVVSGEGIGGYTELDVRLGWRLTSAIELSLVGQNLLHDRHTEFGTPELRGEIERGVYGKLAWEF